MMLATGKNYRPWIAATACVSLGLALAGCPANNNGGSAATTPATNQTQVNIGPVTPTAPSNLSNASRNQTQTPAQAQQQQAQNSPYRSTSPLFEAVAAKDPQRVEALLKAGEDPNEFIQDGDFGAYTVMHTAARISQPDIIRVLVKHGGKVNVQAVAVHKATPLHWAARSNSVESVEALIEAGADVNAVAGVGEPATPLKVATDRGFHDVAVVLRAYGGKE